MLYHTIAVIMQIMLWKLLQGSLKLRLVKNEAFFEHVHSVITASVDRVVVRVNGWTMSFTAYTDCLF
jgi:hypothetical protein